MSDPGTKKQHISKKRNNVEEPPSPKPTPVNDRQQVQKKKGGKKAEVIDNNQQSGDLQKEQEIKGRITEEPQKKQVEKSLAAELSETKANNMKEVKEIQKNGGEAPEKKIGQMKDEIMKKMEQRNLELKPEEPLNNDKPLKIDKTLKTNDEQSKKVEEAPKKLDETPKKLEEDPKKLDESPKKMDETPNDKVEAQKKTKESGGKSDTLFKAAETTPKKSATVSEQVKPEEIFSPSPMPKFSIPQEKTSSSIKKECLYKILVIGELGTGKTSIIKRYVHQFFSQHYRATIGVDFALKVLNWDQSTIIRLQLWDIAGQERFGNMTRVYYKEAVGAFIVFDVTRGNTFEAVTKWKMDLDAKVQLADGSPIPCVLLANKCDQQKEGLVNNPTKMAEFCETNKFTAWFETSAKENINIEEAAKALVDEIVKNDNSNENGRGNRDTSKFPLEAADGNADRKSCAC